MTGNGLLILNAVVFLCSSAVLAISLVLVLHRDYEDGLIGRLALSLLGIGALARVLDILFASGPIPFSAIAFLVWLGLALFLGRHLYRFLRWRHTGEHEWREAKK